MYSDDTYSYMMSNVHLDTIIIAIPSVREYGNEFTAPTGYSVKDSWYTG